MLATALVCGLGGPAKAGIFRTAAHQHRGNNQTPPGTLSKMQLTPECGRRGAVCEGGAHEGLLHLSRLSILGLPSLLSFSPPDAFLRSSAARRYACAHAGGARPTRPAPDGAGMVATVVGGSRFRLPSPSRVLPSADAIA